MNQLEKDIYNLAMEKLAASNLRSDLVLGRLSPAKITSLFSTPRYSKANPGQILADIRSSLRGRGRDVGALTQELTKRGIPYKVRGRGLSPRDIELDLSQGHKILNTPYLPGNYNESFIRNNVNRRFNKVINSTRRAGYKNISVNPEYDTGSVGVRRLTPDISDYKSYGVDINIPVRTVNGNNDRFKFTGDNANLILHETNEVGRGTQQYQNYDNIVENKRIPKIYTSGRYPGVVVTRDPRHNGLVNLFGSDNISPYNNTGYNQHTSATILMNELMDEHALRAGSNHALKPMDDIFSFRKQGPDNPVNRMTGIDLTSSEQPFVPRNIAKNKKEYLKRIRTVQKAEDALQMEHLRKMQLLEDKPDKYLSSLSGMLNDQMEGAIRKNSKEEFFKLFPQGTNFKSVSDFGRFLKENPGVEEYIKDNDRGVLRRYSKFINNMSPNADPDLSNDSKRVLADINSFINNQREDLIYDYIHNHGIVTPERFYNFIKDHAKYKMPYKYKQGVVGNSQQNMDFLINYLRSRGIPV